MIHQTAIIDESVKLGKDVKIGAFCVISGDVEIGDGTILEPNVIIDGTRGKITIGKNNHFYPFVVIGGEPQDDKYKGENSMIEIGDNNIFREYVTVNGGSARGNDHNGTTNLTKIGNNCWLYISSHVAHDVELEDGVVLANNAGIAGHAKIDKYTIIGGLAGVHQFAHVGHNCMIGAMCGVAHDVPPYAIIMGVPQPIGGANIIGMKRFQYSFEETNAVRKFYDDMVKGNMQQAELLEKYKDSESKSVQEIIEFIKKGGKRA